MASPKKFQVVFQGGGAKLCVLLAAAEAIQDLSAEITVTRVAGTSAGAIAACLFAAGIPISRIRERLQRDGLSFIDRIAPARSSFGIGWRLMRGSPIYVEKELSDFLYALFQHDGRQFEKFRDLAVPTFLTAADLRNGEKKVYGLDPEDRIIDRILDSCALPFAFRTGKFGGHIVDGGICENLPVEELLSDTKDFGPVIAISFEKNVAPTNPTTLLQYAASLLNAAIDNSTYRASKILGDKYTYKINTNIGTFDFVNAVNNGLRDHYDLVHDRCEDWLRALSQNEEGSDTTVISPGAEPMPASELMERIYKVHRLQCRPSNLRIPRSAMIVTSYGLLPSDDPRVRLPDDIVQYVELMPQQPLASFSIGLYTSGLSPVLGAIKWNIVDKAGLPVDITPIPVSTTDLEGLQHNSIIFFFSPELVPENGPYKLFQTNTQLDTLTDLRIKGRDWLRNTSTQSDIVECFDVIVYIPHEFSGSMMIDLPQERHGTFNGKPPVWHQGRPMTEAELSVYPMPHTGFERRGWRAQDVGQGGAMGVMLIT